MIVYLFATLLSCWLAWEGGRHARRWPWWIAAAVPLTLVSAIRWDVGTDIYLTYFPAFQAMQCLNLGGSDQLVGEFMGPLFARLQGGEIDTVAKLYANYLQVLQNQEWGFRLLMEFMSWCGLGFRGVIAVTSLLVGTCVFLAIYRQSSSPALAIWLYVTTCNYFLGLNIMRQYVAVGLVLVSVEFIVRRRPLPFLACIAVGMLFHKTVILVAPCYFLCRFPLRPWMGFALVAVALCGSFVAEPVALWLMPKVGLGHYCRYFGGDSPWAQDGFEYVFFSLNVAFMAFGGWYWQRAKDRSPYFIVWYNMTIVGTLFLALSGALPLMKRMNYYFAAPQFLLLPEILLSESDGRIRRILTNLVIAGFALETLVAVCVLNKNEPLPYGIRCRSDHACPQMPGGKRSLMWIFGLYDCMDPGGTHRGEDSGTQTVEAFVRRDG